MRAGHRTDWRATGAGTAEPMPEHERSMTVTAHPDRVFDYVADIHHLPEYLDQMKAVHRTGAERVDVTAVVDVPGDGDSVVPEWTRASTARSTYEKSVATPRSPSWCTRCATRTVVPEWTRAATPRSDTSATRSWPARPDALLRRSRPGDPRDRGRR